MTPELVRLTLHEALCEVQTSSTFAHGGVARDLPLPGLSVTNIGPIPLPLQPDQAVKLVENSEQAPFGKGAATVVDTSVRNCRQIDASHVTLSDIWNSNIQSLARSLAAKLGIHGFRVVPSLYKLVLYPPGGFFRAHKDTEKQPGMFATLVVQLPSKYEQGCLLVNHMGEEKNFDFAKQSDAWFYCAAFYGDCEHELKEVRNGYRLCLIYNLLRMDNGPVPSLEKQDAVYRKILEALGDWERCRAPSKLVMLLDHEYTETNLAFSRLKGRDAAIVEVLQRTGRFELHLALVEKYQTGPTEGDYPGETYTYGRLSDTGRDGRHHTMIDVHDSSVEVKKWVAENNQEVHLNGLDIREDDEDMLDGSCLFEEDDDPDREQYEGYTGNAGPTVDYWFHRAVLVMWPRCYSAAMLRSRNKRSRY